LIGSRGGKTIAINFVEHGLANVIAAIHFYASRYKYKYDRKAILGNARVVPIEILGLEVGCIYACWTIKAAKK
jgi:hypothetical protein